MRDSEDVFVSIVVLGYVTAQLGLMIRVAYILSICWSSKFHSQVEVDRSLFSLS